MTWRCHSEPPNCHSRTHLSGIQTSFCFDRYYKRGDPSVVERTLPQDDVEVVRFLVAGISAPQGDENGWRFLRSEIQKTLSREDGGTIHAIARNGIMEEKTILVKGV